MRLYWSIKHIPELAGLPADEQGRLWRQGYFEAFRDWQMWASLAVVGAGAAVGSLLGASVGWQIVGGAVGGAIGALPHAFVSTELVRRRLRAMTSSARDPQGSR
jgi:hypothetical protein